MLSEHELRYTYQDSEFARLVIVPQSYNIGFYTDKYEGDPLNSALHVSKDVEALTKKIQDIL